jgi:putative DNA primase/helicase
MTVQEKTHELLSLYAGIRTDEVNLFLDIFNEFYQNGYRGDRLWELLCNHYSKLRVATLATKKELLPLLESNYKKAYQGLQNIDVYIIKEDRNGTEEFGGIKYKLFTNDLIALYHFKTLQDTEEVIFYKEGCYYYEGEAIIRAECERVFGEYINTYQVNEILNHVRRSTYIKRENLNVDLWTLNLKNGLFNIKNFEFTEHTPNMLSTIRIPVIYDFDARCPNIEKFISDVVYPEHVKTIKEMIGYCLYHDYTYQNWFLLHGEGANGKSKLISLISTFLGKENISAIGLQDLNQRFATINLYGKSANVVADLGDADLKNTARLKQLTGGDLVTAEPKFKNPFTYLNFAKLIYSCNKVPLTEDKSKAFFRRVIFIPFPNTFVIGENADEKILDNLTTEKELSGLLNVAIDGLKSILNNGGFSDGLTSEQNEELYERASNPVYGFFYDMCEIDLEEHVAKHELYDAFCDFCKEKKLVAYTENKFVRELKLLVRLEEARITIGKQRVRVWKGITIKDVHHCDLNGGREIREDIVGNEKKGDVKEDTNSMSSMSMFEKQCSVKEKNSSIYGLSRRNHGHVGQEGQDNVFARCEWCGKDALLTEYEGIGICRECLEEIEKSKMCAHVFLPKGGHKSVCNTHSTKSINVLEGDERIELRNEDDFQLEQAKDARKLLVEKGFIKTGKSNR